MNIWLLLSLLMAHVIGDFYLQNDKYCQRKEESKIKSPFLYIHSVIMGLLAWAFLRIYTFRRLYSHCCVASNPRIFLLN